MSKFKSFFQKPIFKKIGGPVLRGLLKQIPLIGPPLAEIGTNMMTPSGQPKKHTNLSIYVQLVVAAAIIYDILVNQGAHVKDLLDLIKTIAGAFVGEAPVTE